MTPEWIKHARVGDKVCPLYNWDRWGVTTKTVLTITEVGTAYGHVCDGDEDRTHVSFLFAEVEPENGIGFCAEYFRPVDRTQRQMEALRGLLNPSQLETATQKVLTHLGVGG